MPKYWGKQIFAHGRFPEWVKSKRRREKRKKDWTMVITMAKLRMVHAWRTQAAWAKMKTRRNPPQSGAMILIEKLGPSTKSKVQVTFACGSWSRQRAGCIYLNLLGWQVYQHTSVCQKLVCPYFCPSLTLPTRKHAWTKNTSRILDGWIKDDFDAQEHIFSFYIICYLICVNCIQIFEKKQWLVGMEQFVDMTSLFILYLNTLYKVRCPYWTPRTKLKWPYFCRSFP